MGRPAGEPPGCWPRLLPQGAEARVGQSPELVLPEGPSSLVRRSCRDAPGGGGVAFRVQVTGRGLQGKDRLQHGVCAPPPARQAGESRHPHNRYWGRVDSPDPCAQPANSAHATVWKPHGGPSESRCGITIRSSPLESRCDCPAPALRAGAELLSHLPATPLLKAQVLKMGRYKPRPKQQGCTRAETWKSPGALGAWTDKHGWSIHSRDTLSPKQREFDTATMQIVRQRHASHRGTLIPQAHHRLRAQ